MQKPTTGLSGYVLSLSIDRCSELSPHNGSAKCEEKAQAGMAVFAIAAVVIMVVLWVWMRRRWRQFDQQSVDNDEMQRPT